MGKKLSLTLKRVIVKNRPYWQLWVPARLTLEGRNCRKTFSKKAEAEQYRQQVLEVWQRGAEALPLSAAQNADARRALALLGSSGVQATLEEAVRLALPMLERERGMTVEQLLQEFERVRTPSWRSRTLRNFRGAAASMLSALGSEPLQRLTGQKISQWLETVEGSTSRAHLRRTLEPAFNYAVRQSILPASPWAVIEKDKAQRNTSIDILKPAEAEWLMEVAPEDCKPAYALLLFAGVRPRELTRLRWGDVKDGFLHVSTGAAKTRSARNIEISENLQAWLEAAGPHATKDLIVPPNWKRKDQSTRKAADIANRPDVCRHSFASYHLAAGNDENGTKAAMGHTRGSDTLFVHYRAAVTRKEAAAYWSITPN